MTYEQYRGVEQLREALERMIEDSKVLRGEHLDMDEAVEFAQQTLKATEGML